MKKLSSLALPVAAATAALPMVAAPAAQASETISVYTTAYTYYDNTPAGSAQIAHPVIHSVAGGTGTYDDPVTVATAKGRFPWGTKIYIPSLRKYFIVEDWGSGAGANGTDAWLDLWIGKAGGESGSRSCAYATTSIRTAVLDPGPGYAVSTGAICGGSYSDEVPAVRSTAAVAKASTTTKSSSTESSVAKKAVASVAKKAEAPVVKKVVKPAAEATPLPVTVGKKPAKAIATKAVAKKVVKVAQSEADSIVVKPGDTLSSIARAHGIADWQTIYNLNKAQIDDPDLIYVGQHFVLR